MFIIFSTDANPTNANVQSSCSAVVDRTTTSYDITFYVTLDETFTPAVISVIQNFGVSRFEIDERGNAVPGNAQRRTENLDSSVEKGPVLLTFAYSDEPQLLDGHGYRLSVSII